MPALAERLITGPKSEPLLLWMPECVSISIDVAADRLATWLREAPAPVACNSKVVPAVIAPTTRLLWLTLTANEPAALPLRVPVKFA